MRPSPPIASRLARFWPDAPPLDAAAVDGLDRWPGAYLLVLRLQSPLSIQRPGAATLAAGWHVYVGSARGPGGVRARLRRHFRPHKRLHWHVDQLTTSAATEMFALAIPDGEECAIVRTLTGTEGFAHTVEGFGASDCRDCRSHLLVAVAAADAPAA